MTPNHRVVAVDQRGHGASERRPREVTRAAYVADVVAVIKQLDLHRPVLVGQSLGGHTAVLTAATTHPHLVRALVLIKAGLGSPNGLAGSEKSRWTDRARQTGHGRVEVRDLSELLIHEKDRGSRCRQ
nr:alpha/beta hydrolase [Streptomyces sp. H27-G5]